MGYFGTNAFDNDDAVDWLASLRERTARQRLEKALRAVMDYAPNQGDPWPKEKVESFISRGLLPYQNRILPLPDDWRKSGRSLEEFLKHKENSEREYFASGRYLDEQYGPVEAAIAAGEVVAMWGGQSAVNAHSCSQVAIDLVSKLRRRAVPEELVRLAIAGTVKVLANERYQRMRKFYLEAFQDLSGGDDAMAAVKDLLKRLEHVEIAEKREKRGRR